jgi:surface antigen
MGEPAFQLPDEDKPDIRPHLRALEGGSETNEPKTGHLSTVDDKEKSLYNPSEGSTTEASGLSASKDKLGLGYTPNDKKGGALWSRMFSSKSRFKKRMAIAGVLGGGSIVAGAIIFFAMLPLKIESIVTNLNTRFNASAAQAMGDETTNLFTEWVARDVMPSIMKGKCHSTISSSCVVQADSATGLPGKLYNAWRQNRMEQKLATKYDIVLGKKGNNYFIQMPNLNASISEADAKSLVEGKTDLFKLAEEKNSNKALRVSRTEIRQTFKDALKGGTLWDRTYDRFVLGKFIEKKYGVKRCVMACNIRDKFTDSVQDKKLFAKAVIIRRVISPLSDHYGFLLGCIVQGSDDCDSTPEDVEPGSDETEKTSKGQEKIQANLSELAAKLGADTVKDLVDQSKAIASKGVAAYFAQSVTAKIVGALGGDVAGQAAGKTAADAVPIVGWITLAAQLLHGAQHIGPIIKYFGYAANVAAAVRLYHIYLTSASEMKSGHVDPVEIGSLSSALDTNLSGDDSDYKSTATQTPLYSYYNDTHTATSGTVGSLINPTAHADSNTSGYVCNDGKPVPAGQLVCQEEHLARGNGTADAISSGLNKVLGAIPGLSTLISVINSAASLVGNAIGSIVNAITGPVCHAIPGCSAAKNAVTNAASQLLGFVIDKLIASPFKTTSGGRLYDMMAAGADASYNDSCQAELGCAKISNKQAVALQNNYITEQRQKFSERSMFARMFSTDTPYSLVSHLALVMPTSLSRMGDSLASMFTRNPLSIAGSAISWAGPSADAAVSADDPFDIPQMGYAEDVPAHPTDFWNKNCVDGPLAKYDEATNTLDISEWINNKSNNDQDPVTGQDINLKTNACLLIHSSIAAAGGTSDPSLLPADSENNESSSGSGGGGKFVVGEYNILRDTDDKHASQACANMGMPNNDACTKARVALQAKIIHGQSELGNPQFDLLMTDETTDKMYGLLKDALPDYDSVHNREFSIFWNKSVFTKTDSGTSTQWSGGGNFGPTPWVKLSMESGQTVYAMPLHYSSYTQFDYSDANITKAANNTVDWVKSKTDGSSVVVVAGDIGKHPAIPSRIFNSSGVMANTALLAQGKASTGTDKGIGADQIYASPLDNLTATSWTRPPENPGTIIVKASDHAPVYVTLSLPDTSSTTGGVGKGFVGNDGFGGGNCVDYVKYILSRHSSKYKGGALGDGKDVANNLGALGYTANHTPAVHATVSFPTQFADPTHGHVAIVAQVNSDGSLVVEESNWSNPNRYGTHKVSADIAKQLTYAHTEEGWH